MVIIAVDHAPTAVITLTRALGHADVLAQVLRAVADAGVVVGALQPTATSIAFTVARADAVKVCAALSPIREQLGFDTIRRTCDAAVVSVVGHGIRSAPDAVSRFCAALTAVGITVAMLTRSTQRISALCRDSEVVVGTAALADEFGLIPMNTQALTHAPGWAALETGIGAQHGR